MKTFLRGLSVALALAFCSPSAVRGIDRTPARVSGDVLLSTMQRELQRAQTNLGQLNPAPYFTSLLA